MATKDFLNYRVGQLRAEVPKLKKKLSQVSQCLASLDAEIEAVGLKVDTVIDTINAFETSTDARYQRTIKKLEEKIQKLESMLAKRGGDPEAGTNEVLLAKVTTIAIFDAILGAITAWSVHGDQASDVEAASQTVVFPCVYERVMSGDDPAYLLDDLPVSAELVVQRGREFVQWIRSECETHITQPEAWERYAQQVQRWWVQDGLPLLYGEADPDWEEDTFYTLDQIEVWRNNPADRIMAFPKIHDAMDLLQKHRTEVYKTTRLLEFNKAVTSTRLE